MNGRVRKVVRGGAGLRYAFVDAEGDSYIVPLKEFLSMDRPIVERGLEVTFEIAEPPAYGRCGVARNVRVI